MLFIGQDPAKSCLFKLFSILWETDAESMEVNIDLRNSHD